MNRIKQFLILNTFLLICISCSKKTLKTNSDFLQIYVDNELVVDNWKIDNSLNPDIFEVEVKSEKRIVEYRDGKNSISFEIKKGDTIDFVVIDKNNLPANQRIVAVEPNINFTDSYIKKYKGKTIVDIPEVSELVNIIMVLHKDAEKDENMFDTSTDYYKRVKAYFEPYKTHPIIDTIQKYIANIEYKEDYKASVFSNESYWYYYAMKMNACAYKFDNQGNIKNEGIIREIAKGWSPFDPMKDIALIQDFANHSNFRKFYTDNKAYYNHLLDIYSKLNPIQKMQNWLDNKFKFNYGSYVIYFSPLIGGAHSTNGFEDNGFNQTYMFIARADFDKKLSPAINELSESRVVFTEIDHNYVNPISDKFIKEINSNFDNREVWAKGEHTSAYETPYKVFNEYMTFAVYSLYVLDNFTSRDFEEYIPKMENKMIEDRGFVNFKEFNRELIEIYKKDKNQPIEQIYIKILDWSKAKNSI